MQQGVSSLCKAVEGNFLKMPFNSGSFDAAYAIEATCHADKVSPPHGYQPGCTARGASSACDPALHLQTCQGPVSA